MSIVQDADAGLIQTNPRLPPSVPQRHPFWEAPCKQEGGAFPPRRHFASGGSSSAGRGRSCEMVNLAVVRHAFREISAPSALCFRGVWRGAIPLESRDVSEVPSVVGRGPSMSKAE